MKHRVYFDTAMHFVQVAAEKVKGRLEYLPYRRVKKNKGGLLRDAIRGHWTPPDDYLEFKKRKLEQQENQERLQRKKAEETEAAARQKNKEELKHSCCD